MVIGAIVFSQAGLLILYSFFFLIITNSQKKNRLRIGKTTSANYPNGSYGNVRVQ